MLQIRLDGNEYKVYKKCKLCAWFLSRDENYYKTSSGYYHSYCSTCCVTKAMIKKKLINLNIN